MKKQRQIVEENRLFTDYKQNIDVMRDKLRVRESFDMIERHLTVANRDMCFFYIDGFVKDGEMLRIMQYLLSQKQMGSAEELEKRMPYVEVEVSSDKIRVALVDTGKGIENVELAMKEGYSTATEAIRDLGFGAGMGLPNMKRYSDEMEIITKVDCGTTVILTFYIAR